MGTPSVSSYEKNVKNRQVTGFSYVEDSQHTCMHMDE